MDDFQKGFRAGRKYYEEVGERSIIAVLDECLVQMLRNRITDHQMYQRGFIAGYTRVAKLLQLLNGLGDQAMECDAMEKAELELRKELRECGYQTFYIDRGPHGYEYRLSRIGKLAVPNQEMKDLVSLSDAPDEGKVVKTLIDRASLIIDRLSRFHKGSS